MGVPPPISDISLDALLAGKAFAACPLLKERDDKGLAAVIPPKSNRKARYDYDKEM